MAGGTEHQRASPRARRASCSNSIASTALGGRQRHQIDPRGDRQRERAFRKPTMSLARLNGRVRIDETRRDCSRPRAAAPWGKRRVDSLPVTQRRVDGPFDSTRVLEACRRRMPPRALRVRAERQMRLRSVRQHHLQLEDVVDRLAVEDGTARPLEFVRDHFMAADRRAAGGGDVRRESQAMRPQLRRSTRRARRRASIHAQRSATFDLENAIEILRGVELEAGADRLSRLRGCRRRGAVIENAVPAVRCGPYGRRRRGSGETMTPSGSI